MVPLQPPFQADPELLKVVEKWLNERHADDIAAADALVGKAVMAGAVRGEVLRLLLSLDGDLLQAVVRPDDGNHAFIRPVRELTLCGQVTKPFRGILQDFGHPAAEAGPLVSSWVRVIKGERLGHYLALGCVVAHDQAADRVSVKMVADGTTVDGFHADELRVLS